MLCRLSLPSANKQLLIVAAGSAVSLVIPVMIRKMKFLRDLTWVYAGVGVVLLAAVLVLASTSYGAKLSLMGIQPSEVIKITFVFFMASLLCVKVNFRKVVLATIVAVLHVGILVLSRDLGKCGDLFCHLSCTDLCIYQKSGIYVSGTWRRMCGCSDRLSSFWPCTPESQCVEKSYGCLSE